MDREYKVVINNDFRKDILKFFYFLTFEPLYRYAIFLYNMYIV